MLDVKYMERALELAQMGCGFTNPNPLVGAVIVKEGRIIGEGYHQVYGSHHAEVNAFINATEDVSGATMYVTLEPCSHFGKTPPCANAIVENKIKKVIIGLIDPNPLVAGKGIKILEENGIEVVTGMLEDEGKKLNEIFLKYITTKMPFCIMKTTMSLESKIASDTGDSNLVTREYGSQFRPCVASIMQDIETVFSDKVLLNSRFKSGICSNPVSIIVDSDGEIPLDSKVLKPKSQAKIIIATTEKADKAKIKALEEKGVKVITTPLKNGGVDLMFLMKILAERKIDSVFIEGGSQLKYSALEQGIVDKVINSFGEDILSQGYIDRRHKSKCLLD